MAIGNSCHPWEHRTQVMQAVAHLMEVGGDKFGNYEMASYYEAKGIPITPEAQECGATFWDFLTRVLEELNYLST